MDDGPTFLDPLTDIEKHGTKLPHWQQEGATFFVTFRLADSIPLAKLGPWQAARNAWLHLHPRPWTVETEREYHRLFSRELEAWLDAGSGACELRDPRASTVVGEALAYFEGQRCRQHAWVVMPNHVHTLFSLLGGHKLEELLHSWKSYSSKRINEVLGRRGGLWQEDYHDRLIRSRTHFNNCFDYISRNPGQAKLRTGEYRLFPERDAPAP